MSGIVIIILILLASALICHQLAKRRGAQPVFWGVMGIVFGPLAIPFVFLARTGRGTEQRN